jgi:hypothetical protein
MDKTWSLYCGKHQSTSQSYLGIHNGDITDGKYATSTTNPFLKEAIKQQMIEFKTITFGTKEEMYNYEYYFLSKYDAKNNDKFFNRSNGGGPGIDKSFKPDPVIEKKLSDWIEHNIWNEVPVFTPSEINNTVGMQALWDKVMLAVNNWKQGGTKEFQVENYSVHELYIINRYQVRAVKIKEDKLARLIDWFKNEGYARTNITPIIVVVKDGKIIMLIDGNHRIEAASKCDWDTFPIIKVDISEFGPIPEWNLRTFGEFMNHDEVERSGNNLDDLVVSIRMQHRLYPDYEVDSDLFISIVKSILGGKGSKKGGRYRNEDISRKCKEISKMDKELLARQSADKNFIEYTDARLSTAWYRYNLKNAHPTIFQTIDGIENGGLGGVLKYVKDNYKKTGVKQANLIIHFKKLTSYLSNTRDDIINSFKETIDICVGKDVTINIFFADPFDEQIIKEL